MKHLVAQHMVNILMQSPFYLGLTLEERHRLIRDLVTMYPPASDNTQGRGSTQEPDTKTE
jgi:hypothetical protein